MSCSDIYRSIRSEKHKLGLKTLKLGEPLRRELQADLEELGQRRQQGIRLADPKALQETKRIYGSQSSISEMEKWFYCTIPKTDAAPVQELVIDYPEFRWVLGVICEEHLGGMSVGEFARLFFLEKVVNLTNEPEGFYNLQDVRLADHHMICDRVIALSSGVPCGMRSLGLRTEIQVCEASPPCRASLQIPPRIPAIPSKLLYEN